MLFVISGPSGSGKTTIAREVARRNTAIHLTVSCTTRLAKNGEEDGKDYYFITREEFQRRVEVGDFAEWAEVHSNLYGTPMMELSLGLWQSGDVLLEIDVQGMQTVKSKFLSAACTIFVVPPSLKALEDRLRERRRGDTVEERTKRLIHAIDEIAQAPTFDHIVLNDTGKLDVAVREVLEIIKRSRAHA